MGALGFLLAPAALIRPRLRTAVFAVGAARAVSAFLFPDSPATIIDDITSGLLLAIGGMFPEVISQTVPAPTVALDTGVSAPQDFRAAA